MNKTELIARLKAQQGELGLLIAEIEALGSELLASTPISDLSPEQFARLCGEAVSTAMKPLIASTAEAAHKVIENSKFDDESEQLTGIRRSWAVIEFGEEGS